MSRYFHSGGIALALLASTIGCSAEAAPRSRLQRDVEGYAMAACLGAQPNAFMKDQADGWASNIVQRGHGEIELFFAVDKAVRAEAARGDMAAIMVESSPGTLKPLPLQYCGEIIDRPPVRAAIDAAMKRLAADYRRAGTRK